MKPPGMALLANGASRTISILPPILAVRQNHHKTQYEASGAVFRAGVMIPWPGTSSGYSGWFMLEGWRFCRFDSRLFCVGANRMHGGFNAE